MSATNRMPSVIVHPPEEEPENDPWTCFDSDEIPEPQTDGSPPMFHRDSGEREQLVMPRRRTPEPSWTDDLGDAEDGDDGDDEIESAPPYTGPKEPGEDSEIVEVIKVRKQRSIDNEEQKPQKSTIKSRATRAFRSIRNVATATRNSSRPRKDSDAASSIHHHHPQPPLARRNSIFSLFQPPRNHSTPDVSTPPRRTQSPTPSNFETIRRSETTPFFTFDHEPANDDDDDQDVQDTPRAVRRPTSPTASMSAAPQPAPSHFSTTSSSRRFSRVNIHRIFSFGSEKGSNPTSAPPAARMSRDAASSNSSAVSSEGPQTPIESSSGAPHLPPIPASSSSSSSHGFGLGLGLGKPSSPRVMTESPVDDGDVSFEMKLDSLHFESLSFDPNRF